MKSFKAWVIKRKFRLLLSLAMLAAAIILGFSLDGYTGPESEIWQRLVFIFLVIATGLSALAGAFLGLWGFLGAYGFVLIISLPQALPEPYNRYFSFLYILALFALPHFRSKKQGKAKGKIKPYPKPDRKNNEAGGGPTSILAANMLSGRQYQIIRSGGMVYVYFIGGELKLRPELIQPAGTVLRPLGKKDFSFALEHILSIRVKDISNGNSVYHYKTTVKTSGRTYSFWSMTGADEEHIPSFWQTMSRSDVLDAASRAERSEPAPHAMRLKIAERLKIGCCAYLILVSLAWLFLDVPYALFSVLNLLGLPAIMTVYFLFQDEMTLLEAKKSTRKASIAIPFAMSGTAVTLRTLLDFNILDWGRFFLCGGICAAVFAAVFLLCSKEWKKRSGALGYLAAALVIYCLCAPMQLNYILDNSEPTATEAYVVGMWISSGSKSPDSYNLKLEKPDGTETTLEVGKSRYEALQVGDSVDILTYGGFFGISYAFVE